MNLVSRRVLSLTTDESVKRSLKESMDRSILTANIGRLKYLLTTHLGGDMELKLFTAPQSMGLTMVDKLLSSDERLVSDLVRRVYSAILEPGEWVNVLEGINDILNGGMSFLVNTDLCPHPILSKTLHCGSIDADWSLYATVSHLDPKNRCYGMMNAGDVLTDFDFITEDGIDRSEFYQRLMLPNDLRYTVSTKLNGDLKKLVLLSTFRSPDRGPVEHRGQKLMALIAPHLATAYHMTKEVGAKSSYASSLEAALQVLRDSILIVDQNATVIHANASAEELLRTCLNFRTSGGQLTSTCANATKQLQAAVTNATLETGTQTASELSLERSDSPWPMPVLVLPVPARQCITSPSWLVAKRLAIVVIKDLERIQEVRGESLTKLFGLTLAEARLATKFCSGQSIKGCSESLGVSIETARWTMKRIMEKTSTHSQADLARLLVRISDSC